MVQIIENQMRLAQENMDLDQRLLKEIRPDSDPILHLYEWKKPSMTYGYFIDPENYLYIDKAKELGIDLGRRPTGGGMIFHIWDLAFALIIPQGHLGYSTRVLDNYRFVNQIVTAAVESFLKKSRLSLLPTDPSDPHLHVQKFCMAKPTIYDVMLDGKKVAGAAQRRKSHAFLHQGSISIGYPHIELLHQIIKSPEVIEAMKQNSFSLLPEGWSARDLAEARSLLKQELSTKIVECC
ncbi:MAG: hypothetical protein K9M07_04560 [Simkaniaceae bacterium]|nr:hypothetical protein [Simkaniaceae bacterium]MCF7852497.1 hypothetical protein [Simkaniaceae bacterium]